MEENNNPHKNSAIGGLSRLALGEINDAVRLLITSKDLDDDTISQLDLFQVAEIKKSKEGVLDIKFYDRLKALELLLASEGRDEVSSASSFFGALESAAKLACDSDGI